MGYADSPRPPEQPQHPPTSFQLHLENKLHEILPYYNTLFDALSDYKLFNDGEVIQRDLTSDTDSTMNGSNVADMRYSKYPQNQLTDITDGNYVTDQNYNTNTLNNTNNVDNETHETITRSPTDKMRIYEGYLKNVFTVCPHTFIYNSGF